MLSAQLKMKQNCCASSSKVTLHRIALSADGKSRGTGLYVGEQAKLPASSCCRETWNICFLEDPSQCNLHQNQFPAGDMSSSLTAVPSQNINFPRQKKGNGRHLWTPACYRTGDWQNLLRPDTMRCFLRALKEKFPSPTPETRSTDLFTSSQTHGGHLLILKN